MGDIMQLSAGHSVLSTLYWFGRIVSERKLAVQLTRVLGLNGGRHTTGDWRGKPDEEIVASG